MLKARKLFFFFFFSFFQSIGKAGVPGGVSVFGERRRERKEEREGGDMGVMWGEKGGSFMRLFWEKEREEEEEGEDRLKSAMGI